MGVLPLQFLPGESAGSLGLTGREAFDIARPGGRPGPAPAGRGARHGIGRLDPRPFGAIARLDGPIEVDYYRQGGILPAVLRRLATGRLNPGSASRPAGL